MKNTMKAFATIAALAACGPLLANTAHAQGLYTVEDTWSFDSAPGHCDSVFQADGSGACAVQGWWSGGRAGYDSAWGNGYLWLANDQSWNSWNIEFNPYGYYAHHGRCDIAASVYAGGEGEVAEVDLWEDKGGGVLVPLDHVAVFGNDSRWTQQRFLSLNVDQAVLDDRPVLLVLGRHQGDLGGQFIALDQVSANCWVFN